MMFRALRADEVETRVNTINQSGLSLLLYKDARCDQNILDETVGAMNWQRRHSRDNANCTVSIWDEDKKQWISKEDTGTESYTEKEKGLASDSFKRACVNWGIGRELYTAPFIWIPAGNYQQSEKNGKPTTYDRFTVTAMKVENGAITALNIENAKTKKTVFTWGDLPKLYENPTDICPICGNAMVKPVLYKGQKISPSDWIAKVGMCDRCYQGAKPNESKA